MDIKSFEKNTQNDGFYHRVKDKHCLHLNQKLTREGERILLKDINGKPLTPAQIANAMIHQGKQWEEYVQQADIARTKRIISKHNDTINAGAIYGGLEDTLSGMDETMRQNVFAEIDKIKAQASQEVQANGGSWNCVAGENIKACNLINSIKADLEEKAQTKRQDDDGITM